MLYNKDYLFIHIPRTAGKCIKSSVIPFLKNPIYLAQKAIKNHFFNKNDFILINSDLVHSSLQELKYLKNTRNLQSIKKKKSIKMFIDNQDIPDIDEIKNIVICLRDPLSRAKSLYKFQRLKNFYNKDFQSFLLELGKRRWTRNTKSFCTIDDEIPKNVTFIRFSYLEQDLCKLFNVSKIGVENKKHNGIRIAENEKQKTEFYKVKDINKAISIINSWEKWSIEKGFFNPITEKDF